MTGLPPTLGAIDAALLAPLVRTATGREDLEVTEWVYETFGHSLPEVYGVPPSVIRFRGIAQAAGHGVPWALVLKIVTTPPDTADPSAPDNGAREPLAYRSGLLDAADGLRAPRCVAIRERPDGSVWLWLEEVVDDIGRVWPAERYMLAARHLGRWNGAHVADRCVPHPWLSRSPLRDAVRRESFPVEGVLEARADPLIAAAISPESASSLLALATHRDALLDDLDRLPRALCHWDAHRANLFSRTRADGEVETVAIDWEGLGWGPVGADLSKMLSQTVHFFGVSADALPQVDAALFEHYMEGLRDAGWSGDRAEVRFAYTAASAMRLLLRTATALQLTRDARARASFERATGQPFASIARGFASTLPYYLSLVEEAAAASGRS